MKLKLEKRNSIKKISINFAFSKDFKETRTMHTKSAIIETVMNSETDEIINELFDLLLQKYQ